MKRAVRMAGAALAAAVLATFTAAADPATATGKFTLTSPEIKGGGKIAAAQVFNGFGCQGANVSPALSWSGAPKDTQSFALMVHDPDAPTGSGWWHWVVYNIPATATRCPLVRATRRTCSCPAARCRDAPISAPPATAARARRRASRTTTTSGCMP